MQGNVSVAAIDALQLQVVLVNGANGAQAHD